MRTQDEIVEHYRQIRSKDSFGFAAGTLLCLLDVEHLAEFVGTEVDLSDWSPVELSEAGVLEAMREYMPFAWEKALDHRGISASRSVAKMVQWLWLLGNDELVAFASDPNNYAPYGGPILAAICGAYDIPIPHGSAARRMATGHPCRDGCDEGCRS